MVAVVAVVVDVVAVVVVVKAVVAVAIVAVVKLAVTVVVRPAGAPRDPCFFTNQCKFFSRQNENEQPLVQTAKLGPPEPGKLRRLQGHHERGDSEAHP